MTCRELIGFLDDYLDGALAPEVTAEFNRHLEICRPCRDYLNTYRDTIRLSRAAMKGDEPASAHAPEALVRAVLEAKARLKRGLGDADSMG